MSENKPKQIGKRRAPSTAFKPGQSGNPGGRPAQLREVVDLARQHTSKAIERLLFWAKSDHPAASPKACEVLLDRAWGKATQEHNVNHNLPASAATDAALATIAFGGGAVVAASEDDSPRPEGVVH